MSTELTAAEEELLAAAQNEAERKRERISSTAGQPTASPGHAHGVKSVLWPKKRPLYLVTIWLSDAGDHFECSGLDVTQLSRGKPIGSTLMRQLPVGELIQEAIDRNLADRVQAAEVAAAGGNALPDRRADDDFKLARAAYWNAHASTARGRAVASGEGTGRRYAPGHLEEVARIALNARRQHKPTHAAVAETFGISKSAAANQISRARAQGLFDSNEEEDR